MLTERVRASLIEHRMISPGTRVSAALSGGADSVVLLHILNTLSGPLEFVLSAVHINHHLRGEESDADELWVRDLASRLGVELRVFDLPVNDKGNVEESAREARRSAFRDLLSEQAADRIALGHTMSDQAETVLFRVFRGAGLRGLAGMRPISPEGLIRPLLGATRQDVRSWATENRIEWREDSSNTDLRFRRNFIRRELLPRIQASLNPEIESVLARMATLAQGEESYWEETAAQLFNTLARSTRHGWLLDAAQLNQYHPAARRRLLRYAFETVKGNLRQIDGAHVEAVVSLCETDAGHNRVLLPGIDALRSFATLRISRPGEFANEKRHYRAPVSPGEAVELPFGAGTIRINSIAEAAETTQNCVKFVSEKDRSEFVMLNFRALGGPEALSRMVVRNWEPGDAYQPAGHRSHRKIKELFQEGKVLLWERRHWPVLDLDGEIIWARQFGPAFKFQAVPGKESILSLEYTVSE